LGGKIYEHEKGTEGAGKAVLYRNVPDAPLRGGGL
jgi:hypothetical protein